MSKKYADWYCTLSTLPTYRMSLWKESEDYHWKAVMIEKKKKKEFIDINQHTSDTPLPLLLIPLQFRPESFLLVTVS
jgi:hypothetical protein